jgi:hypothetical protein
MSDAEPEKSCGSFKVNLAANPPSGATTFPRRPSKWPKAGQTLLRKGALLKRREMYGHLHYFTRETALETLRETGYEIVDCSYTPRANNLGRDATQRLLKLPRALFFAIHKDTAVRVLGGYSLLILAR